MHQLHRRISWPWAHARAPADFGNYRLEVDAVFDLGHLTLTVKTGGRGNPTLSGAFHSQARKPPRDGFVLDLKTGRVKAGRSLPASFEDE